MQDDLKERIEEKLMLINSIRSEIGKILVGQRDLVDGLLIGLFTKGHILIEGVPGLAKTSAVKALSDTVRADFKRIQFTPDLLPADLVGTEIYRPDSGTFSIKKGPIFHNIILADEINRAPSKVQSALLEAMQEHQVTIGETTFQLPDPFLVLATQNPIEQEGTYPLPEAQMDRFLLYVHVPYPPAENEAAILRLVRGEKSGAQAEAPPKIAQETIFAARREVNAIHVAEPAERYMVDLVIATREPQRYGDELAGWIRLGASPRATLALDAAARAHAWLHGQEFVSPENIRAVAPACLAHRIHLSYEAEAAGKTRNDVIEYLLQAVVSL